MSDRFDLLALCCSNPISRTLALAVLPNEGTPSGRASEDALVCSTGECSQQQLLELATSALLRLSFFGLQSDLNGSIGLLRSQLEIALEIPDVILRLQGSSWPATPHHATQLGRGMRAR